MEKSFIKHQAADDNLPHLTRSSSGAETSAPKLPPSKARLLEIARQPSQQEDCFRNGIQGGHCKEIWMPCQWSFSNSFSCIYYISIALKLSCVTIEIIHFWISQLQGTSCNEEWESSAQRLSLGWQQSCLCERRPCVLQIAPSSLLLFEQLFKMLEVAM